MKSIKLVALLVFASLLFTSAQAQQPYAITAGVLLQREGSNGALTNNLLFGATIDYGFFNNCTVVNCKGFQGSKIVFSGNNQVVDGAILEEGSTLIMDTSSGDVYAHGHIGANVVVLNGSASEGMMTLNSTNGLGDTIDLRGFLSVNCFYGTKHTSTSDEYFRSFIGGNYALIDVNDSIGVGIINHNAKYGHHFYSGSSSPDTVDVDSLGVRISKFTTGVATFNSSGRMASTATLGNSFITNPNISIFGTSVALGANYVTPLDTANSNGASKVTAGIDMTVGVAGKNYIVNADTTTNSKKLATQGYVLRNMGTPFSPMTLTTIGNTVFGDSMEFAAGGNTNHWSTTETFSCGSSLIVVTPTYTDGLLGVADNGICFMGDMGIDFNGNFIKVNDASQEITFQSGGNLIFNGSAIFNGGVQLTSYTKNGGLLTTDSLGNVVQIDTASGSTRVLHGGNTWGRVDLTADVTGALPPATGGTGFSNSGTLSVTPNTTISGSGTATISMPAGAFTYTMPDTTSQIMGAIFKRVTGKTAASTVQVHGVGAADGSFLVSANILVTTATLHSFTATVTYTDEGNTSRTVTMQFSTLAGAFVTAMTNAQGAVPYEGVPLHIRCKASTNITISTTGTFTTVNYNLESCITKLN